MALDSLKGLFLGRQDIINVELGEPKLDKALTKRFSARNRGSVRLSLGRYYTRQEWEQRRAELVAKQLP
ncbi:MAG: hypothetical protein HY671_01800 [Chloroflexi bacterium]|nr:hypothetical protein [Chloroflexota bacterium]